MRKLYDAGCVAIGWSSAIAGTAVIATALPAALGAAVIVRAVSCPLIALEDNRDRARDGRDSRMLYRARGAELAARRPADSGAPSENVTQAT